MVTFVVLALWCTVILAPDTPIGRAIHRWMVAKPAARLARITRGQVLLALLMLTGAGLVTWLIGHEAVRLMTMGLPELASWITMFEVTAYLDARAAIVTAASATRFAAIRSWVRTVLLPRKPSPRAPRTRPTRNYRPAADNDDHPVLWLRAA